MLVPRVLVTEADSDSVGGDGDGPVDEGDAGDEDSHDEGAGDEVAPDEDASEYVDLEAALSGEDHDDDDDDEDAEPDEEDEDDLTDEVWVTDKDIIDAYESATNAENDDDGGDLSTFHKGVVTRVGDSLCFVGMVKCHKTGLSRKMPPAMKEKLQVLLPDRNGCRCFLVFSHIVLRNVFFTFRSCS